MARIAKRVNTVAKAYIFPGDSAMTANEGVAQGDACCEDEDDRILANLV